MSRRDDVTAALDELPGFVSAQEAHAAMRADGSTIGLATVYRVLQAMLDDGEVDLLQGADGETRYRRCSPSHHHHLVCRGCGDAVEVRAPSVERWAREAAARHGFRDVEHVVELTGVCRACAPSR